MGNPRIGSVKFLNARPLDGGLGELVLDTPAGLVSQMRAGNLDAALLPVVELFERPGYLAVRGAGIFARCDVWSVLLIHECPLREIRRVALDPASRTSAMLVRLILEHEERLQPRYVSEEEVADARLLIGDRALAWRKRHRCGTCLDLGRYWHDRHGTPFVFAVWAIRDAAEEKLRLAESLRAARRAGETRRESYARDEFELEYLTRVLSYDVSEAEIASVDRFQSALVEAGLIANKVELSWI